MIRDLATNNNRVTERSWLIPKLTSILNNMTQKDIIAAATKAKIPFAPLDAGLTSFLRIFIS